MSSTVRLIVVVVLLPVAALVAMLMGVAIPDRFVMDGLFDAIESGSLGADSYELGYAGSLTDGYSECKRMTIGFGSPPGSILDTAVRSTTLGPCELAVPRIRAWAEGDGLDEGSSYFRYWNGSAVVFRPLLATVGLDAARVLAALGVVAAAGAFWYQLATRVGRPAATLAITPLVVTTDFIDLAGALLHALGMIVALTSAALILRLLRGDAVDYATAGVASGAVFLFLGDMTNPDAAWTLTAASGAVVAVVTRPAAHVMLKAAATALGWAVGFVWMWAAKWLISVPVLGWDVVRSVVADQVEFRLAGETDGGYGGSLFGSIGRAWDAWLAQPFMPAAAVVLLVGAVVIARRDGTMRDDLGWRLLIASPAAIPVVWHLVLRNHVHFHAWFTYRSFSIALGVVLLAATARLNAQAPAEGVEPALLDTGSDSDVGSGPAADDQVRYGSTASGSMS